MSEFFATNEPDPPHWTLNSSFSVFRCIWVHFGSFHYYMKLGARWAELVYLMQNFVPKSGVGIFKPNAPDPPHWTLNSCFGAFHSVLVHLGSFHYCMKLGALRCRVYRCEHFHPYLSSSYRCICTLWFSHHQAGLSISKLNS